MQIMLRIRVHTMSMPIHHGHRFLTITMLLLQTNTQQLQAVELMEHRDPLADLRSIGADVVQEAAVGGEYPFPQCIVLVGEVGEFWMGGEGGLFVVGGYTERCREEG